MDDCPGSSGHLSNSRLGHYGHQPPRPTPARTRAGNDEGHGTDARSPHPSTSSAQTGRAAACCSRPRTAHQGSGQRLGIRRRCRPAAARRVGLMAAGAVAPRHAAADPLVQFVSEQRQVQAGLAAAGQRRAHDVDEVPVAVVLALHRARDLKRYRVPHRGGDRLDGRAASIAGDRLPAGRRRDRHRGSQAFVVAADPDVTHHPELGLGAVAGDPLDQLLMVAGESQPPAVGCRSRGHRKVDGSNRHKHRQLVATCWAPP